VESSDYNDYGKGYQEVKNRVTKIDNTKKDLGWSTKVDMKAALKHIFDAYRGQLEDARALAE
jgi:nucleoside-diphosphate-sugar epimerase